ncbi:hypothetical protein F5Y14DRAFT_405909 [Nemania sp. NC0429]|nr:hypothetical protein F5Y14DRAFT_405909 [Nemania sp. NC0429]
MAAQATHIGAEHRSGFNANGNGYEENNAATPRAEVEQPITLLIKMATQPTETEYAAWEEDVLWHWEDYTPSEEEQPISPLAEVAIQPAETEDASEEDDAQWEEEPATEAQKQIWRINGQGHLTLSESLSAELTALRLTNLYPTTDEALLSCQRAAVASLVAEDRHLDAFDLALQFAYQDIISPPGAGGLKFFLRSGRCPYAPGLSYPVVLLIAAMRDWRNRVEVQRYLAYYLFRGMLRRYGGLPFPDGVDVRLRGFGDRWLLAVYGAIRDKADGDGDGCCEAVSVRQRILRRCG